MFNKEKFSNILSKINDTYSSMTEFAQKADFDRTYISKYINMKLDNPPTPKILGKIAEASNGITSYYELMSICDYVRTSDLFSDKIHPNLINAFKETFEEYGISHEDVVAIEKISKSKSETKNKDIAKILAKYDSDIVEKVFYTLEVNRQNLSNEIVVADIIKETLDPLGLAKIGFSMKDYAPPTDKQREQIADLIKVVLRDNEKKDNK